MLGWELPPHNSGGLGVACLQLSKALADTGADIEFIIPYSSDERYDFMKVTPALPEGVEFVNQIGIYDSFRYRLASGKEIDVSTMDQHLAYEVSVAELAKKREFDIIHAHDWLTFRAALRVREQCGKPLIVQIHSIERDRAGGRPGNPLVREIEATTMLLADRVIAVSEHTKRMIVEDYAIPPDKISVVHNSIEAAELEPLDKDNSYKYLADLRACGWKVVVNVGRLTIQKGLSHLMNSAAEVIQREPKTIFLLVGSGELRDELLEQAAELGIAANVMFAGFQRGKRWRDAYSIADLFVMPSVSEPFGLTPLEATGYGSPVLISKQSGVSEVLNSCLKVDFWDEYEMANQIVGALRWSGLRDELRAGAFREYQQLSWGRSADKLMEIYRHHHRRLALV